MTASDGPQELVTFLVHQRGLSPSDARRIVAEVTSYFAESVEEFVTRRHRELQREGHRNASIYRRIAQELDGHLFRAGTLSERQIRRMVYG